MSKPLVLYHAGCFDGYCSAWVAKRALGAIEAIPVQYDEPPPINECGREVYILDFSYPRQVMRDIIGQSKSVVVLDHHRTAERELAGLMREYFDIPADVCSPMPIIIFNMEKSGARLTWEFFNGSKKSPWLVDFVEDRDLWTWKLPNSRAVNANLRSLPLDFKVWDKLDQEFSMNSPEEKEFSFIEQGNAILRREKQIIDDHVRHAREIEMDGYKVLCVNATVLFSEIAGTLAKERPFGVCWFDRADGKRQFSLRSTPEGVDVSEIAKRHGGGGHRSAAGFSE